MLRAVECREVAGRLPSEMYYMVMSDDPETLLSADIFSDSAADMAARLSISTTGRYDV